jgi:hypothetical protein
MVFTLPTRALAATHVMLMLTAMEDGASLLLPTLLQSAAWTKKLRQ